MGFPQTGIVKYQDRIYIYIKYIDILYFTSAYKYTCTEVDKCCFTIVHV